MGNWWTWLNSSFTIFDPRFWCLCMFIYSAGLFTPWLSFVESSLECWFICFAPSETVAFATRFICVVIVESLSTLVEVFGCCYKTRLQNLCNKDDWMWWSKMQVVFNKYTVTPDVLVQRDLLQPMCSNCWYLVFASTSCKSKTSPCPWSFIIDIPHSS